MQNAIPVEELKIVQKWALAQVASGEETPWSWYQCMKLIEAIDMIFMGHQVPKQMDRKSQSRASRHLRLIPTGETPTK